MKVIEVVQALCLLPSTIGVLVAAPQEPARRGQITDFKHSTHVPSEWLVDTEVWRDCRGCHDYEKPEAERTAIDGICVRCHIHGTKSVTLVRQMESSDALFDHRDHLQADCKTCHRNAAGPPAQINQVPDHLEVPAVHMSYCHGCHDPEKTTEEKHARFLDHLNRDYQARQELGKTLRRYFHRDHVSAADVEKENHQKCTECHVESAAAAARNMGDMQFAITACDRCHTARFEVELFLKESLMAATFHHQQHLEAHALASDKDLDQRRCFRCHTASSVEGRGNAGEGDFVLRELFRQRPGPGMGPASCLSCHYHKEWGVEEHGHVAECLKCHVMEETFTDLAAFARNRPTVPVNRPKVSGFVASGQLHPFITGATEKLLKECNECHIAKQKELPSRINTREFNHKTHLSAKYGPEDCEKCHPEVKRTSNPAEIRVHTLPDGVALQHTPETCASCHKGRDLRPRIEDGETRKVLAFSHLQHLKSHPPGENRLADCLDCHVIDKGNEVVGNSLPPRIAACTWCHNHVEYSENTGNIEATTLKRCFKCHKTGVPRKDQPVLIERLRLKSTVGFQVHRAGQPCIDCHLTLAAPPARPPQGPMLGADVFKIVPHVPISRERVGNRWKDCADCLPGGGKKHEDWNFRNSANCSDCHWFRLKQGEPNAKLPHQLRAQFGSSKNGKMHPFPGIPPSR